MHKIEKTDQAWRDQLGDDLTYQVTRKKATERPFSGAYWNDWREGGYRCVCCGASLFDAKDKFDAGCGWPSFSDVKVPENIQRLPDTSHNMQRTEVLCRQCGAHLGHVFEDGPTATQLRYCINSASLMHENDRGEGLLKSEDQVK